MKGQQTMKKIIFCLGAITFVATGTTNLMSCDNKNENSGNNLFRRNTLENSR